MEFEEIYRAYFPAVFRYLRQLCGDEGLAEELTSETFFRALQSVDRFRGECEVRVWLCQIAKNCWLSYAKKHRRQLPLSALEGTEAAADPAAAPEERLGAQEDAKALRRLLQALPEPYRDVLLWHTYAELSYQEIGELFGKSANWACVTCHRARNMIRKQWEEEYHD